MRGVWGRRSGVGVVLILAACARPAQVAEVPGPERAAAPAPAPPTPGPRPPTPAVQRPRSRIAPPEAAYRLGLMPVASTGVSGWRLLHANYDGRGVLIGILDSGVDPGVAGLTTTSTGEPKILDLRDFSGEGAVTLAATTNTLVKVVLCAVLGGRDMARAVGLVLVPAAAAGSALAFLL